MKAFSPELKEGERVLFRVDVHPHSGVPTLLVQSLNQPDWSFLLAPEKNYLFPVNDLPLDVENLAVKKVDLNFYQGQLLVFRLRANPTVKKTVREAGKEDRKVRIGLVREEDQMNWLERKFKEAGAEVISARPSNEQICKGERRQKDVRQGIAFLSVQFDGILRVIDTERFLTAYQSGIGSGKGLGFGLLSLAPVSDYEMSY
jgi:CRISPR system Cascade subunit CasE